MEIHFPVNTDVRAVIQHAGPKETGYRTKSTAAATALTIVDGALRSALMTHSVQG